jgi:transglutaminase-like putative cysteine protease
MIAYRVRHETVYSYSHDVAISHNVAHLLPRPCERQELENLTLLIEPTPSTVGRFDDYFGNPSVFFIVTEPHARLRVLAESRVEIESRPPVDLSDSPPWEEARQSLRAALDARTMAAYEYVFDSSFVRTSADLADYGGPSFAAGRPLLDATHDLCRRIHRDFRYDPEATTLATPLHEVLEARHGVCQDFAHVMIGAMRSLGLAVRYVSGYIRSRAPAPDDDAERTKAPTPGEPPELVGADASHAWVSVFCPRAGWVDFDPTNDLLPSDRHVVLAWGRDYDDVSPLQGVTLGGGLQTVNVGVSMRPFDEAAR